MRRSKTMSMAEVLQDYIKTMNYGRKLNEVDVVQSWIDIVGRSIANHTKKIYLNNGVLFVYLDSSVVRNELLMLKQPLIQKINGRSGTEVVKDIVLK